MPPPAKNRTGYYVMARGWQDHELFEGDKRYSRRDAWCWPIEHARFRASDQMVKGVRLQVGRGELTVSIRGLANLWGWSKSGSNRFINALRARDSIRTRSGTARGTSRLVITICNYDDYQLDRSPPGPTTGTTTGTIEEEDRERRKEHRGANSVRAIPPEGV